MFVSTDADHFLLDGNNANTFLVAKKYQHSFCYRVDSWASYNINQECCGKECDAEEVKENVMGNAAGLGELHVSTNQYIL